MNRNVWSCCWVSPSFSLFFQSFKGQPSDLLLWSPLASAVAAHWSRRCQQPNAVLSLWGSVRPPQHADRWQLQWVGFSHSHTGTWRAPSQHLSWPLTLRHICLKLNTNSHKKQMLPSLMWHDDVPNVGPYRYQAGWGGQHWHSKQVFLLLEFLIWLLLDMLYWEHTMIHLLC